MALPLLPGNSFNRNLGKEKFNKSQHFDYSNGIPKMVGEEKPGIGGEPLLGQKKRPKYTVFPKGEGSDAPSWVAFDKQVLCFDAYFQESVHEKREEQFRIRRCKIYFYLEDDTIQVVEPEIKNSGIPQGTFIRRHRIPLPPPYDDECYTLEHFNINQEMVFYSRTFTITDCDVFTRNFLRKLGVRLNSPSATPKDPYSTVRNQMQESMKPLRPFERLDKLKQFLDHDRHVLRFFCFWDDSDAMFGDPRELTLHYFLADDTIEIREVVQANSGRDAAPMFLQRNKLPKHAPAPKHQPGEITDRTVLNVFGPMGHGGRYIVDSLKTGAVQQEFYKDCDLAIGAVINVWGRKVIICDCDGFTKEYYRTKYGLEDFTPVRYRASSGPRLEKKVPPYNGFGSEEDSLCSCLGLMPKPPQKDFRKMMEKDRHGLDSNVLRFVATMITDSPVDSERQFIISYFLCDDTIAVFEPPQRNSGVIGGKFLERGRIKKPDQELFKSEPSEYFKTQDLFVGAKLSFNGYSFQLVNTDEYTFNYMEKHADEFPMANISTIISKMKEICDTKLKEIKKSFVMNDPTNTGVIEYTPFRNLLTELAEGQLSEHEIMTVGRHYSIQEQHETATDLLVSVAQEQLRKKTFESFLELSNFFVHNDRKKSGFLPVQESRTICKAFKLPVADDLLREIMARFQNDQEELDYNAFLSAIDWKDHPLPYPQPGALIQTDSDWNGEATAPAVKNINYMILVEDVFSKQD
ncbi:EF-hand domain-containing family member C2-like [Polyodon spathula]|uniref:EF-hand domain-containing family member C2-like n=1 Tax=Polyodon spathula TaxID=7913 RepID=UPI001B7E2C4D|nr:EF-hand domain-containing family member C2-like [Polyodon spathula]